MLAQILSSIRVLEEGLAADVAEDTNFSMTAATDFPAAIVA
jgi:hypothetical protein